MVFYPKNTVKYFLSVFILTAVSSFAWSQSTPIPDTNFEQALVTLGIDTNGMTGDILNCDAENVTTLNIFDNFIHNLDGIEAFISLRHLNVYSNNLEEVDLSQNIDLKSIDIKDNQLSALNILANLELEELDISNNNISSLDVSNNLNLEYLSCNLNNLSSLDVSGNPGLEFLLCYGNNLNTIDVSLNTNLKSLFVGTNNLSNLDISNNTLLEILDCSQSNISNLNLENNPALSYLNCSNNGLTSLNVSSNPLLEKILMFNNEVTNIDLSSNPQLSLFYAANNQLTSLDLSDNGVLRRIQCQNNELTTVDLRNGNNGNIVEFNMSGNESLSCIMVDETTAVTLANWNIGGNTFFVANEEECATLSVKDVELEDKTIRIYPNPVMDTLTISNAPNDSVLEIFSLRGDLIFQQSLPMQSSTVNVSQLSAGIYMASIHNTESKTIKKLVVK